MDPASLPLPLPRGGRGLPTHAAALGDARRGAARRDAGHSCSPPRHSSSTAAATAWPEKGGGGGRGVHFCSASLCPRL